MLKANSLLPSNLQSFAIFGEPLYGPCDAVVREQRDGLIDSNLSQVDPEHSCGNYIEVACEGLHVLMCHLQKGSIRTASGQSIARGQLIAKVGNSGFSTEPHLHIQATRLSAGKEIKDGIAVPMLFEDRFLVRNDLVR